MNVILIVLSLLLLFSIPYVNADGIEFRSLYVSDSFGKNISNIQPGQMIQITAEVTNHLDSNQEFAFVITTDQLKKDVRWITGILSSEQTLNPAISHIFDQEGTYNIQAYLTLLPKDILDPKNPTDYSGFGTTNNHLANPLSLNIIVGKQSSISSTNLELSNTVDPNKSENTKKQIPDWIRNNAKWWTEGNVDDKTFAGGIQFLIKEGIIQIPETTQSTTDGSQEIPTWIKNNADWWSKRLISDDDFLQGIQFMVENGIISLNP